MRASDDGPETTLTHSKEDAEAPATAFRFRTVAARVRLSSPETTTLSPRYPLSPPFQGSSTETSAADHPTTSSSPLLPSSPPAAATTALNRMEAPAAVPTFSSSSSSSTAPRPHRRLLASPALGRSTRTLLPLPRAVASSRAPLLVSHPPPAPAAHAKVDRSGRFCSPRAARELAMMISYAACLEGTDVVRLFDRRVAARSEPGFVFNKVCLLSYNHMSFDGGPLEVGTEEEAEKLMSENEKDSANEAEVLSAPPKLVYNNFVLRLARDILVAVASGWDQHVDIIDKIVPQNWKDEPVARILELCILHIAMAEMTSKGTPHKVAINEAVDLAKRFCDGGAPRVINGCLRTFVKDHMNIGTSQPAESKA